MRYYKREDQDAAAAREAATRREAASLFPIVREVVRRFDGKVYNIRFQRALQEAVAGKAAGQIYTHKTDWSITIEWYPAAGYDYQQTIARMKTARRIDGTELDASLKDCRTALLREAARIEEQAAQIDTVKAQIDATEKLLERLRDGLSYPVREIYGLNFYVQHH